MKIEVLGTGCTKCKVQEENVKQAIAKKGIFAQVEKVEDITAIMAYGVMSTPAIVINGEVKASGKVLSVDEVLDLL
jgi:small redox-active disulfide protein 2